jgi:hypothetical protein
MNRILVWLAGASLAAMGVAATAAAPSDAPAGTTGLCKDGSYSSSASKRGACKGHKGVKEWYAQDDSGADKSGKKAESAPKKDASTPTPAAASAPTPASAPAPASTPAPKAESTKAAAAAAPGGGHGMVWVNTESKVYHCEGDRWYGKTKAGAYMSEADAKAKGNRAERGKSCS